MGHVLESKLLSYLYRLCLHAPVHGKFSAQVSTVTRLEVSRYFCIEVSASFQNAAASSGENSMEVHCCQEKKNRWKMNHNEINFANSSSKILTYFSIIHN